MDSPTLRGRARRPRASAPARAHGAAGAERVDEIVDLLFELVARLQSHFGESAADCGISPAQAVAVQHMDRPLSMRDLAVRLGCDASNVTGLVDRLEARGLAERRPDPSDRRVKHLVLTPAGAALRERFQARLMQGPALLVGLSATDQELLRDLLRRSLA